jgi:hypothetical protein
VVRDGADMNGEDIIALPHLDEALVDGFGLGCL